MNSPERPRPARAGKHFLSGLGSGVSSAILLQPLDLLKTRVQQSGASSLTTSFRELRESPHFIKGLWRGTVPSALRTGFGSALYFSTLNSIRQYVQKSNVMGGASDGTRNTSSTLPKLSNSANLVSGSAARTFAGFVLMPLTVLKVRFESSFYSYSTMNAAALDIYRKEGVRGFFSGYGATAMRDAPYAGMYVLFYEMLKTRLGDVAARMPQTSGDAAGQMRSYTAGSVNFMSGILAGAICSAISNPFDVVKTRIQLKPKVYRNVGYAAYTMVKEDGVRCLWNGLVLRMSRKALSSALAWTVYEELIRRSSVQ